VDGVSLTIEQGEIFGLLGPNGAGKTTFIRMLITLARRTGGELEVFGIDPAVRPADVRAAIGYVSQEVGLDRSLTGREHLELSAALYHVPRRERPSRIETLLQLVELGARADSVVRTYSGGMKKRLEIACGLIHRPRLLVLDEPTLGLDIATRRRIWEYLRQLRADGVTILLTTHYLEEADALCDRLAIIDRGRIQASGSPEELKASLRGEVVTLRLAAAPGATAAAQADGLSEHLRALEGVTEVRAAGAGTLHLSVAGPMLSAGAALPRIVEAASARGAEVESVAWSRPTLDDVFIVLTCHTQRD
jgi:ABC-2 type transport system ATP-binding protein